MTFLFADDYVSDNEDIKNVDLLNKFRKRLSRYPKKVPKYPEEFQHGVTNPHEIPGAMDLNDAFRAYDKLEIEEGYVFDYVYVKSFHGGYPLVYARLKDEEPLDDPVSYFNRYKFAENYEGYDDLASAHGWRTYLNKVTFEKSYIGSVQFAYFCSMFHRFYLYWHSLRNFWSLLLTDQDIEEFKNYMRNSTISGKEELEIIDISTPIVELYGNKADVYLAMVDYLGGSLYDVRFELAYPHDYLDKEVSTIFRGSWYLF